MLLSYDGVIAAFFAESTDQAVFGDSAISGSLTSMDLNVAEGSASIDALVWTLADGYKRTTTTYDNANRLVTEAWQTTASSGSTGFVYDSAGRLISENDGVSSTPRKSYVWDALSRMSSLTDHTSNRSFAYTYAPGGQRRLSETMQVPIGTTSQITSYRIDDSGMLARTVGGVTTSTIGRGRTPLWESTNGVPTSFGVDPLGNIHSAIAPTGLNTDPQYGQPVALRRWRTSAYGEPIERYRSVSAGVVTEPVTGSIAAGFGFKGLWRDTSGQIKTDHRMYEPSRGNFTSGDPAMAGGNWYGWPTDPIQKFDPSGLAGYFFDGTNNHPFKNNADGTANYMTNVRILYEGYQDGAAFYMPGIGSGYAPNLEERGPVCSKYESATGASMDERIGSMMGKLESQLNAGDKVVDLFGFSRGSATAVKFLNEIQKKKESGDSLYSDINIRFIALFDEVPSDMGIIHQSVGRSVDTLMYAATLTLSIQNTYDRNANSSEFILPRNMKYKIQPLHLVALDEQRKEFAPTDLQGALQIGLRGVHSNVGGGYGGSLFEIISREIVIDRAESFGLHLFNRTAVDLAARSNLANPGDIAVYDASLSIYNRKKTQTGRMMNRLLSLDSYDDLKERLKTKWGPSIDLNPTDNSSALWNDNEQRHFPNGLLLHPSVFWFKSDPANSLKN